MAGAVAEAGAAEEAAESLKFRRTLAIDHGIAKTASRDAPMRARCCREEDLPSKCGCDTAIPFAALAAQKNITPDMNKHERQSRDPADQTTLPDDIGRELSHITTEVIDVSDAPPIAPRRR